MKALKQGYKTFSKEVLIGLYKQTQINCFNVFMLSCFYKFCLQQSIQIILTYLQQNDYISTSLSV